MTDKTTLKGGRPLKNLGNRALRPILALAGGLLVLPFLTSPSALQDMTSLIEGQKSKNRWQTFLVEAPAGSIHQGELAFADLSAAAKLPGGAGVSAGGRTFSLDTGPRVLASPDEARVRRSEKGSRVLSATPAAPPKAFTAGSILDRHSMLQPGLSLGAQMRASFARRAPEDPIALAMAFRTGKESAPVAEDAVMVASLERPELESLATQTAALAYAPAAQRRRPVLPFSEILKEKKNNGFVPPLGQGDHAWAATPLPPSAFSQKEQTCLADGIYFEARGEPTLGQAAVAQVILNRVRNPSYPDTICGVVYQNKNWRNRCQFSFACDGTRRRIANPAAWETAKRVAGQVTRGEIWLNEVGSATHYHAAYVRPRWARAMERVEKIGRHVFYRTFKGGWN